MQDFGSGEAGCCFQPGGLPAAIHATQVCHPSRDQQPGAHRDWPQCLHRGHQGPAQAADGWGWSQSSYCGCMDPLQLLAHIHKQTCAHMHEIFTHLFPNRHARSRFGSCAYSHVLYFVVMALDSSRVWVNDKYMACQAGIVSAFVSLIMETDGHRLLPILDDVL